MRTALLVDSLRLICAGSISRHLGKCGLRVCERWSDRQIALTSELMISF